MAAGKAMVQELGSSKEDIVLSYHRIAPAAVDRLARGDGFPAVAGKASLQKRG